MTKTLDDAIREIQDQITEKEKDLKKDKETVNTLCKVANRDLIYIIVDEEAQRRISTFRTDEFYGQPLASSVTKVLETRRDLGAATPEEIYNALIAGGFKFESKNDAYAKRSLIVAMSKNTKFHRLPNGRFGLSDWYPGAKRKSAQSKDDEVSGDDVDGQTDDEASNDLGKDVTE